MTPADHNKMLGIMHLIYGGFFGMVALIMGVVTVLLGASMLGLPDDPNAPPAAFIVALMSLFVFIYGVLSLPSLLAGYAMLKRRSWARVVGIVAACISSLSFPFGSALCVYTLWFLLGDAGKEFERQRAAGDWRGTRDSLGQAPASSYGWEARGSAREHEQAYRPPQPPPNWRD